MSALSLTKIIDEMWDSFEKQVENCGLKPNDIEWAARFIPNQLLKIGQGMLGLWNSKAAGGWGQHRTSDARADVREGDDQKDWQAYLHCTGSHGEPHCHRA